MPGSCTQVNFAAASFLVPKGWRPGRPLFLLQRGSKSKTTFMSCWECHGHTENIVRGLVARNQECSQVKSLAQSGHHIFLHKSYFFLLSFGIYLLHILWVFAKPAIFMLNIKKCFLNVPSGWVKEKVSHHLFFHSYWMRKQKYVIYLSKI